MKYFVTSHIKFFSCKILTLTVGSIRVTRCSINKVISEVCEAHYKSIVMHSL